MGAGPDITTYQQGSEGPQATPGSRRHIGARFTGPGGASRNSAAVAGAADAKPLYRTSVEVSAFTPSFPSGHATGAIAVYGFIAYIVARGFTTTRQRFEVAYWTAVLVCFIGFSRMLLGLHYASDVAAGFLVGGFWLLFGLTLAELNNQKHRVADQQDFTGRFPAADVDQDSQP
ncbi:MAG: phosphatase PAP2 family protein [Pseudomonadales bacterium]